MALIIGYPILFVAEFANLVLIQTHKFNPDAKYQRVNLIRTNPNATNLVTTIGISYVSSDVSADLAFQDRLIDWFNVEGKGYTLFRTFKWNCAMKQRRRKHADISLPYLNYFLLIVFTISWII